MMKEILIFLTGGLCGAGIAYFVTKSKCEKDCQKDINEIKEQYEGKKKIETTESDDKKEETKTSSDIEEKEVKKTDYISEDIEEEHIVTGKTTRGLDKSRVNTSKTNYSKIKSGTKNTTKSSKKQEDDSMDIIEISDDKFAKIADDALAGENDYEVMSVLYSRDEQKVFAENGMVIDRDLIGDDILTSMEDNCDEGDYIYCENKPKKMVFEICFSE